MYSMVLMAALTTGGQTPDWCFHRSCGGYNCGCYGCWGCGGCHGYTCSGCYGCYGSCWGCHGCWGCWGSYGYSYYSCSGCYGCHGCYGCGGCWSCGGSPYAPGYISPGAVMPPAPDGAKKEKEEGGAGVDSNRAKLVVEVPADAKLFIDDQLMKSAAATRVFNTPTLEKGQTYYYELKVEVARDGVTRSETRKVLVRAGERARAVFTETGIVAAAKTNTSASK
ncbi:MAG: TIGR03000 domain-containing protein [Planctomycetes bacterium]|nr:TIGR03000 domain-containing protein [Planctomycetota bacterium]